MAQQSIYTYSLLFPDDFSFSFFFMLIKINFYLTKPKLKLVIQSIFAKRGIKITDKGYEVICNFCFSRLNKRLYRNVVEVTLALDEIFKNHRGVLVELIKKYTI